MRILLVSPRMTFYGGAEVVLVRLGNALVEQGHEVSLLAASLTDEIRDEFANVEIVDLGLSRSGFYFLEIAALRRCLKQLAAQFDVINIHNFPAEVAALGIPGCLVWLCNEPPRVRLRPEAYSSIDPRRLVKQALIYWSESRVVKNFTGSIVADAYNARRFQDLYGCSPIEVAYGIDTDFFAANPAGLTRGEGFQVLHVGIIQSLKRQIDTLHAFAALYRVAPHARLVFAGSEEPHYGAQVRRKVLELGLEEVVRFTGHVSREEVRSLFWRSHVLLHPVDPQGGWLAPFEAISARLPVITSTRLTAASILSEHDLAEVDDDTTGALLRVFDTYEVHAASAEERARWIGENMSWERYAARMAEVFTQLVEETSA